MAIERDAFRECLSQASLQFMQHAADRIAFEAEEAELEEEMNTSAATDYVRLSEISERMAEIDSRIEELFLDMEEAEEFLRENKS
jgi:hypothetical protein